MQELKVISKKEEDQIKALIYPLIPDEIQQFTDLRLGKIYDSYLLSCGKKKFILKRAEKREVTAYQKLQETNHEFATPKVKKVLTKGEEDWLLLSYFEGEDLQVLSPGDAEKIALALADLTNYFYSKLPTPQASEKSSLEILEKLPSEGLLFKAYQKYCQRYFKIPQTFSNDDLLPINVLANEKEICLIDWGYGRQGSYVNDLARFCAFYREDRAFFEKGQNYLDQNHSVKVVKDTYYQSLFAEIKNKINPISYERDLTLALLHQYLLCLKHLEMICPNNLTTANEWFYEKALEQAKIIIDD